MSWRLLFCLSPKTWSRFLRQLTIFIGSLAKKTCRNCFCNAGDVDLLSDFLFHTSSLVIIQLAERIDCDLVDKTTVPLTNADLATASVDGLNPSTGSLRRMHNSSPSMASSSSPTGAHSGTEGSALGLPKQLRASLSNRLRFRSGKAPGERTKVTK